MNPRMQIPLRPWVLLIAAVWMSLGRGAVRAAEVEKSGPSGKAQPKTREAEPKDKDKDKAKKPDDDANGGVRQPSKTSGIDEEYVRDNLKSYLNPTEMEVLDDGRVRLVFDLTLKGHEQDVAFTPNISSVLDNNFRWTIKGEEDWKTYSGSSSSKDYPTLAGIKATNAGLALINCWFVDEVEMEADFALIATFSRTNTFALVYSTEAQQALGANAGTQCITFKKGKPLKTQGTVEPLLFRNASKLVLKVKGGTFESVKDKRSRQKMKYDPKEYASGRVGFLWSGGVGGIISRLEIVGKVDWKRMAKELRDKAPK